VAHKLDVIDSDGHVLEPADLWTGEYMDPDARGRAPAVSVEDGRLYFADGRPYAYPRSYVDAVTLGWQRGPGVAARYGDGRTGAWDPAGRIADLDLDGIDAAVVYPTMALASAYTDEPALAAAMARAYNRWLADWCSAYPERLFGAAMLPFQSVGLAVEELRYARETLALPASVIRPHRYQGRTIHSPEWDPLWAAAEDLDCPMALHGGSSWPEPQAGEDHFAGDERLAAHQAVHVVIHPFEQQLACVGLIQTRVFDRFPRLRVAFLESGGGWIVPLLDRLERHVDQLGGHRSSNDRTRLRPTEYFQRNCWISFEPVERSLGVLADFLGPSKILWGTDYPHSDGFFPGAPEMLRDQLAECSEATKRAVLGGGARAFYGL
jgi:predicted TIM-barrel fold metal-dependent hydrolase